MLADFNFDTLPPKKTRGIYLFTCPKKDSIYYVGMSHDLGLRLSSHTVPSFLKEKGLEYLLGWRFEPEALYPREKHYIEFFKPMLNTSGNCYDYTDGLRLDYLHHKNASSALYSADYKPEMLLDQLSLGEQLLEESASYASVSAYLKDAKLPFKRSAAYNYIKLTDHWHIVQALGMQSKDPKSVHKSLRLCRTLKVIDWYLEKVGAGADPQTLTFELYWEEQEKPNGPTKKQLLAEVDMLRGELEDYKATAVPSHIFDQVSKAYQDKAAELEQTKKELEKAKLELAALKPTYKFTPPTETPKWVAPV